MTTTPTLFSGISKEEFLSWFGREHSNQPADWIPPEEFLQALNSTTEQPQNLVWLYRAPWLIMSSLNSSDSQKWLESWLAQQTEIINFYHNTLTKLKTINIDTTSSRHLVQNLPTTESSKASTIQSQSECLLLSTMFEEFAPKYWDVFEALESISWIPEGEPIYRHLNRQVSEKDLFVFLDDFVKKNRLPATEIELLKAQEISADAQRKLAYERSARYQAETDLSDVREHFDKVKRDLELMVEIQQAQIEQIKHDLADQESQYAQYKEIIASSRSTLIKANMLLEGSANNV